jgi:hypothetical protein
MGELTQGPPLVTPFKKKIKISLSLSLSLARARICIYIYIGVVLAAQQLREEPLISLVQLTTTN